jgi:hypothetical protein
MLIGSRCLRDFLKDNNNMTRLPTQEEMLQQEPPAWFFPLRQEQETAPVSPSPTATPQPTPAASPAPGYIGSFEEFKAVLDSSKDPASAFAGIMVKPPP